MNTKLDRVLNVVTGVWYIMMLPIATATVLPIIPVLLMAKADYKTWREALKQVYIGTPMAYITGNV